MGIPWAACVLAHRFNAFKWRDWLATIDREYAPLMVDRPLVARITPTKAWANRLAVTVNYQRSTRHPFLRPLAVSTPVDEQQVVRTLTGFVRQHQNFWCSAPDHIAAQRSRMLQACERFANDYGLQFKTVSTW